MLPRLCLLLAPLLLCSACATAPPRLAVAPEPYHVPLSEDCRALGRDEFRTSEIARPPYGWTQFRVDIERGVVTKVEILDSSPKGVFDAAALAKYGNEYFPSLASAKGCIWTHKWD